MISNFSSFNSPEPRINYRRLSEWNNTMTAPRQNRFLLTRDLGEMASGMVYSIIMKETFDFLVEDVGENLYTIKLNGIGEYYFMQEGTNRIFKIIGGNDKYLNNREWNSIDRLFVNADDGVIVDTVAEVVEPPIPQLPPPTPELIPGPSGPKGEKGERGERGFIGERGEQGPQGLPGEKGEPGERGVDGVQGIPGEKGDKGDRGDTGPIGPVGARGEKGDRGDIGATGPKGDRGDTGLPGPVGPKGDKGEKGDKGDRGEKGEPGKQGKQGVKGIQGTKGAVGKQGAKGEKGDKGPKGEKGDTGKPGEPGVVSATYPLKLQDRTIFIDQKYLTQQTNYTTQSGGGGNVDVYVDGNKMVKNLRSINFGEGFTVEKQRRGIGVTVSVDAALLRLLSPGVGVMYLKNNTSPTTFTVANERQIVAGTFQTGMLDNFIKDPSTSSLKYTGLGGRFHVIVNFNFTGGSQDVVGFYIGVNRNQNTALDPNADRISESEIYINSASTSAQPVAGTVQTILDLNTNDRLFFIVQNRDDTHPVTVQFLKYVVHQV